MTDRTFHPPASQQERRARDREEMTTAILEASRVVMRRDGVAGLNLHEVARMVGIQTPGLYKYFAGKSGIYDALFSRAIREFRPRLEHVWADYPAGWARLEAWMWARMRFAQEHPDLDRLLLSRDVPGFTPSAESMEESRHLLAASQHAFSESLSACGLRPDVDLDHARGLFFAMIQGLTILHLANEAEMSVGSGFYGSLIPDAIMTLRTGWMTDEEVTSTCVDDHTASERTGEERR